jgi:hypothetical protein
VCISSFSFCRGWVFWYFGDACQVVLASYLAKTWELKVCREAAFSML